MPQDENSNGLFVIDLRGLELSEEQVGVINDKIQEAVAIGLTETTDLENVPLVGLGPGIVGLTLKQ